MSRHPIWWRELKRRGACDEGLEEAKRHPALVDALKEAQFAYISWLISSLMLGQMAPRWCDVDNNEKWEAAVRRWAVERAWIMQVMLERSYEVHQKVARLENKIKRLEGKKR